MLRRFAFAALVVSARLATAADGPVPDFFPPAANAVIGIHLRAVIDSGLIQSLVQSFGGDTVKSAGAMWTSSSPVPGVDPLKDLDEIVIAATAEGDHPPTLAILRGRFPADEIGKGAGRYRGVPIREVKGAGAMALIDPGTILAGDLKEVRAAIDRRETHTGGLDAALARRASEFSGRYAIWGVGNLPVGYHPPSGAPDGLASLDRFDFGIAVSQGLEMAATLHVRAPEDAQKLAGVLMIVQMMAQSQPAASGAKIETHVDNGTLSLSLALTEEALKKAIEQQRAGMTKALSQPAGKAIPQPAARPPARPPVSNEVKIVTGKDGDTIMVTLPGK
jgi:hypothetical protein